MGRHASTGGGVQQKLRKGLWSPEEDEKLYNHIIRYGVGCWSSVPKLAGMHLLAPHGAIRHACICWSHSPGTTYLLTLIRR
uniref:Uncharacterized protein n=1 Tax=Arundo donax TaxID=35708 RepID=A0A0A9BMU8_ARUDO